LPNAERVHPLLRTTARDLKPELKRLAIAVNSVYNGWRFEDPWLDRILRESPANGKASEGRAHRAFQRPGAADQTADQVWSLKEGDRMRPRLMSAFFAMILALAAATALAQQDQRQPGPTGAPPSSTAQGMPAGAMGGAGGMPMMGMMRMMMGRDGMGGMAMMAAAMSEHVEGRLAFLKTELRITDAQLPLWNNFAQAVRDNAKAMGSMMQGGVTGTNPSPTLPDKLAMREKMMSTHLEALRKLKAAIDPLYPALTDEQKKAADQLMLGPMGMM
jgi:hypothetical protein